MKHIKLYEDYNHINESKSKAVSILAKIGKHAVTAIVTYLVQNPEVIQSVFKNLESSSDPKVKGAMKDLK